MKDLFGVDLPNPVSMLTSGPADLPDRSRFDQDYQQHKRDGGDLTEGGYFSEWRHKDYLRQLEEIRQKHPDKSNDILPQVGFESQAAQYRAGLRKAKDEAWERSGQGFKDYIVAGSGILAGGLADPVNWITAPVGFASLSGVGAKGLALAFLKQGATNAAVEAAVQPQVQAALARAGLESGFGQAAMNVGSAFVLGGAIDLTLRGSARALRYAFGFKPVVKDGQIVGWTKGDAETPPGVDPGASTGGRDETFVSAETVAKADAGDLKAAREIAEKTGMMDDPEVRGLFEAAEADQTLARKPAETVVDVDHEAAVAQGVRAAAMPEREPIPAVVRETPPATGEIDRLRAELDDVRAKAEAAPDDAKIKARLDELQAQVDTFDNLGNDVLETARLFRDNPEMITGDIPLHYEGISTARSLADLSDQAFAKVASGAVPPEVGRVVADFVTNKADHARIVDDVMARKPRTIEEARTAVRELLASPDYRAPDVEPGTEAPAPGMTTKQLDDPYGKEAQAQVERLEREMAEELAAGRGEDPRAAATPTPEERIKAVADAANSVRDAIREVAGMIPEGVSVRAFQSVSELPGSKAAQILAANARLFATEKARFEAATDLETRAAARAQMDVALQMRGMEAFYADKIIWVASYAMNPKGRIAHEAVHALRQMGKVTPDEIKVLADRAREIGLWNTARENRYRNEYAARVGADGRPLFTKDEVQFLLDEEAAAHLIEDRAIAGTTRTADQPEVAGILQRIAEFFDKLRNLLISKNFKTSDELAGMISSGREINPAEDVVQAILGGKMLEQQATRAWMRDNDITAMAVRPSAVEPTPQPPGPRLSRVTTPDGSASYDVEFEVVNLSDLKPATGDLQPRDRSSRAASAAQVQSMAGNLNPDLLIYSAQSDRGAPIIDENGVVLSGNGRVSAIRAAREMGADGYQQYIARLNAEGFDTAGKGQPVLVRRIKGLDDAGKREFAVKSNQDDKLAMSAGEQARVDRDLMTDDTLALLDPDGDGGLRSPGNRAFVRAVMGKMSAAQRGAFVGEGGELSPAGVARLEAAIFARAYDDRTLVTKIVEDQDGAGMRNALLGAAPAWAQMRAVSPDGFDVTQNLVEAVQAVVRMREKRIKPNEYFAQQDAFSQVSPITETLIRSFYNRNGTRAASWQSTRDLLKSYARIAMDQGNAVGDLMGATPTPRDIIEGQLRSRSEDQAALFAMVDVRTGREMRRDLDALGFYSKLDEVLGGFGPKDKITSDTLQKRGVKAAELEARGLKDMLADGKAVPVSDLARVAGENRVTLNEVQNAVDPTARKRAEVYQELRQERMRRRSEQNPQRIAELESELSDLGGIGEAPTKWQNYSLDPSNPTYRETVIHLPVKRTAPITPEQQAELDGLRSRIRTGLTDAENARMQELRAIESGAELERAAFQSGHFSEPNIIGHMMTSMTSHQGRPVYTIDQIQSDWGQKLRDGGVRDEAKIAELKAKMEAAKAASAQHMDTGPSILGGRIDTSNPVALSGMIATIKQKASGTIERAGDPAAFAWMDTHTKLQSAYSMALAEYKTADASVSGNPLVNTTDQWVDTTLRRAIRQAAEADAEYIAIPSGDTVLSYNPGDTDGMRGFYNDIVPKNLRKLLSKIDKDSANPQKIDKLDTPSKGPAGEGFTLFPLTDKVKQSVKTEGQVMFAFAGERARTADQDKLRRARDMEDAGSDRLAIWNETGWFRGVDGKWRFEISDKFDVTADMKLTGAEFKDTPALRDIAQGNRDDAELRWVFQHPELFAAYPGMRAVTFNAQSGRGASYGYNVLSMGIENIRQRLNAQRVEDITRPTKILMHEGQHFVQDMEGFARGGSPREFSPEQLAAERARLMATPDPDPTGWSSVGTTSGDMSDGAVAFNLYQRLAGEVEARTVEKRLSLTPEQRAARPPWEDYPIPESEQIVKFADGTSLSVEPVSSPAPVPGPAMRGTVMYAIKAFHGSPHDFDKFDMIRIGTGEGAQAFGFGLYFAESEGVASFYRDNLTPITVSFRGRNFDDYDAKIEIRNEIVNELAARKGGDLTPLERAAVRNAVEDYVNVTPKAENLRRDFPHKVYDDARSILDAGGFNREQADGRLYEVRIDADPEDFLDWDKPLAEQGPKVQSVLRNTFGADTASDYGRYKPIDLRQIEELAADMGESSDIPVLSPSTPEGAKTWRDAGVVGVKYLDAGSRTAGEGSRNYVLFDDSLVKIVAKDGKPVEPKERSDLMYAMRRENNPGATRVEDIGPSDPHPGRVLAYHGTNNVFDKFDLSRSRDLGIHFGTSGQANQRADAPTAGRPMGRETANVIPAILDVRNPLDLPDLALWSPAEMAVEIENASPILRGLTKRVEAAVNAGTQSSPDGRPIRSLSQLAAGYDVIRNDLTDAGYDAVRYWNATEGDGWSYIVWEEGKVTSQTSGDLLYAMRSSDRPAQDTESPQPRALDVEQFRPMATALVDETIPADTRIETVLPMLSRFLPAEQLETAQNLIRQALPMLEPLEPDDAIEILTRTLGPVMDQMSPQAAPQAPAVPASDPMFAMYTPLGQRKRGAVQRAQQLAQDLADIEARFQGATGAEREKLHAKRATLLRARAVEKVLDDVTAYKDSQGRGDAEKGLLYVLDNAGEAQFEGLFQASKRVADQYLGYIEAAVWEFRKGAISGDLRRKMTAVKTRMDNVVREMAGENSNDPLAKTVGTAINKVFEELRQRFNAAGGDIPKLNSWIMPQWHDPDALMRVGREAWVDALMRPNILDRAKMVDFKTNQPMTDEALREMLRGVWKNITSNGAYTRDVTSTAPQGVGAMYKRNMEHRVIHFKDAKTWLRYMEDYGGGDVYSAVIGHINMMARDIAAMERLGPNPRLAIQQIQQIIMQEAEMARTNRAIFDELNDLLVNLRRQAANVPNAVNQVMTQIAAVHRQIDTLRGGRPSPQKGQQIALLQQQLFQLHRQLTNALGPAAVTPQQQATFLQIQKTLEELSEIELYPVMSKNPSNRARDYMKRVDDLWSLYSGLTNTPTNSSRAGALVAVRNWISASTLVMAPLSAITDQSTQVAARLFIGMPVTSQLASFVKGFGTADRQAALHFGLGLDQAQAAFESQARYVGSFNARSWSGWIADRSHAWSGLSPMTQASKIAFGLDFMRWMRTLQATPYQGLASWTQLMLKRSGISPAEWAQIQRVAPEQYRGGEWLSREAIAKSAGDDLADKYQAMLLAERSYAVLEGNARGRTWFVSDSKPGTLWGEIQRSAAMLKSFPTTYAMLIIGRQYQSIMSGRYGQAAAYGSAIFFGGTLLGAMVLQMKAVAKGEDPEDMTTPSFWTKAFMQSGGAGIFGDFIGQSINRQGMNFSSTLAGPMAAEVDLIGGLTLGNAAQYARDEKSNTGRELVNYARRRTPGMFAPWYVRLGYERMLLDEAQKIVDPDRYRAFRTKIQNTRKRTGSGYWWPPGQPLPPRSPDFGAAIAAP